ncbi:MAG: aminoacyl-histidine dipeptidase [Bacteroides graminisolvens]|jgi:dipeptidase D|uniref:Cytosol non-specific dipeptidase n=1 Tax=Bacteroides graminisolvens DSM 19988 = JCM 15093 TaxID=1121097 RepID=A0A069D597_9BACE|nr:aminoacyl-histidine dipeptidase [Bacteroides graminisolvens]MBP6062397.1 aminoacyl-histidine dipeptidase [Bacteroides sp.]MBP9496491.1 aminoacyl-histidine dipeptidase [Bacteroides sp.]MEA4885697.1 aminoacyl-histidine dipeptidase [Bacteroides graminisolvens]GAK37510.1 aminoacyl-histidine dipeptidase [Bacteroides graminisolvens DSM 19988 = JCM 15093]HAZ58343.1 aminoacyl-histidine dipeptidase [Bacteroides graminisolvens]
MELSELKPESVFYYFSEICKVPRPSKKEEKIISYLENFAAEQKLEIKKDEVGNILIKKPATPGKENLKTVVLQSHVDMVCEKNNDVEHDFLTDPIETIIDGEWLKAKGTTLGADNGIGVATELAILAANDIEHGPIECLFTIDEETGLTGAFALKEGFMSGDILLNLDSEDEGELFIGCAGGIDSVGEFHYREVPVPTGYFFFRVDVKGLKGGHSGGDIHLGRGNANKILNRFLSQTAKKYDMYICEVNGGNLRNAIPREAYAICAVPHDAKEPVRVDLNIFIADIENEFAVSEPDLKLTLQSETPRKMAIDQDTSSRLLKTLYAVPHGVYAMSQDIPGLVETSTNLASIKMIDSKKIKIETSQRSSILSARNDMANTVRAAFELGGARVSFGEGYPGWKPNPHSEILEIAVASYKRLFGVDAKVKAIHAGLECGLFLDKYPGLDMISFGPTLTGVHSPDERMHIPSVEKFWNHLLDVLANVPTKK